MQSGKNVANLVAARVHDVAASSPMLELDATTTTCTQS